LARLYFENKKRLFSYVVHELHELTRKIKIRAIRVIRGEKKVEQTLIIALRSTFYLSL
jgi:hypothetical protein